MTHSDDPPEQEAPGTSRRRFLQYPALGTAGLAAAGAVAGPAAAASAATEAASPRARRARSPTSSTW